MSRADAIFSYVSLVHWTFVFYIAQKYLVRMRKSQIIINKLLILMYRQLCFNIGIIAED